MVVLKVNFSAASVSPGRRVARSGPRPCRSPPPCPATGRPWRAGMKERGGSGGSLEPCGPLPMHLHTVYMAYSGCLPTLLNTLAARTCFSQALSWRTPRARPRRAGGITCTVILLPAAETVGVT
jgi:hypothetical protein